MVCDEVLWYQTLIVKNVKESFGFCMLVAETQLQNSYNVAEVICTLGELEQRGSSLQGKIR